MFPRTSDSRMRAPKPQYTPSSNHLFHHHSARPSPVPSPTPPDVQQPRTSNNLDAVERANLIRKSQKLTQLFGATPHADTILPTTSSFLDLGASRPRPTHASSASDGGAVVVTPSPTTDRVMDISRESMSMRRYSTPLTPSDVTSFNEFRGGDDDDDEPSTPAPAPTRRPAKPGRTQDPSARTSFISLSDDDSDGEQEEEEPYTPSTAQFDHTPDSPRLTPEEQAEAERRRNREKLAKLHRFLGSRVPTNLVLGTDDPMLSLPVSPVEQSPAEGRPAWMRRRNSSSAELPTSGWSDERDRLQTELNHEEKAINVRRAVKMEKVFGVAPPQTLYHTRHAPALSISTSQKPLPPALARRSSDNSRPLSLGTLPSPISLTSSSSPPRASTTLRKRQHRRGASRESSKQLIPKDIREGEDHDDFAELPASTSFSNVYVHYQHSLKSLNDIIDRDDRESLAELHEYLHTDETTPSSKRSSVRSDRRRSLPARASNASLASAYTQYALETPPPEVTAFQVRRRRTAKLMAFFGVDYRVLISDIVDSIEDGVSAESKRGTLNADEVRDLLQRLRQIKSKRDGIH